MSLSSLLEGRVALVFGTANKKSIAWAVAKRLSQSGAKIVLTYQDPRLEGNVLPLAAELPDCIPCKCDLTVEEDVAAVFKLVEEKYGRLDILIHSVAYALREDLDRRFLDTSQEGFQIAQTVSAYTLVAAARGALPLMEKAGGGSILAMTYHGSERVIPNYNVMGVSKAALEACVRYLAADLGPMNIRVNALSPGPLNTLAARGITGLLTMLKYFRERAPLRRNTDLEEVADTALFFSSDMSRGITGEVLYVDCGYHITGM